jgi:phosphate transport system substrate-binding protein
MKRKKSGGRAMKKLFTRVVVPVLVICGVVFITVASAQEPAKQIIRVNGAGMASDQVDKLAKRFMDKNPDISVVVVGSSAGKGFQALLEGMADIAMMSREVREGERSRAVEKGFRLAERPMGNAAIAVITSQRNPVNELTLEQLRKMYTGQIENWKDVGGPDEAVRCLTRRIPESGGAVFFWNKVMHEEPFGSKTMMTETWETIMKICTGAQDLPVGIVPSTRSLSQVKVLAVKKDENSAAVRPTEDAIRSGNYPIVLQYGFAWDERTAGTAIPKFVEFCQGQ